MSKNPTCSGLPSVSIGIGITKTAFEFISATQVKPSFENNELYFTKSAFVIVKDYINNIEKSESTTKKTKNNSFYGFSLLINEYNVDYPSVIIYGYPQINWGCNDCQQDNYPPICDFEKKKKRVCAKVKTKFGKITVCEDLPYFAPTKCLNEIIIGPKKIEGGTLFKIPQLDLAFSFQLIPEIETQTKTILASILGAGATIGTDPEIEAGVTSLLNLQILKLKIGLKIKIKTLRFYYGEEEFSRKGFNISNITLPLIPTFDVFNGEQMLNIAADSQGNLSVYYLIKTFSVSLYTVLDSIIDTVDNSTPGEVPSVNGFTNVKGKKLLSIIIGNTGNFIENILKSTKIIVTMGLLVCPLPNPVEDVFLSFVISASISSNPFQDLNKLTIPSIPSSYNIPTIPNNDYVSDGDTQNLNKLNQIVIQPAIKKVTNQIDNIADYVKNTLEKINISVGVELPIPLILKSVPIVPVA
jgi:hypothetical protein